MRAVTLHRPWSDAIVRGPKRVENRTWEPPRSMLGKTIAIHAGKRFDESAALGIAADPRIEWPPPMTDADSPQGIVGVATLRGWLDLRSDRARTAPESDEERSAVWVLRRSPWWVGPVGWWLDDVVAIEPVPCRGAQGLWTVPASTAAIVEERARKARAR